MVDLSGQSAKINPIRIGHWVDEVRSVFPGATDFSGLEPWYGMRPATPKGTPILGATPIANQLLEAKHGALGFTLAMATGRILADQIADREPAIPLDGFRLSD